MIKMIPPYIHEDVKSAAEKKIYDLIKNDPYFRGWTCLHSLGLSKHISKVEGEIDFLLIGPEGIFCLEVKGGNVSRKEGVWYFTNRYGITNSKKEGPFKQVAGAHYSLKKSLGNRFKELTPKVLFGYGVLFPDIVFNTESVEWDNDIIYDKRDRLKLFSQYIKRLIFYWQQKHYSKEKLSVSEINSIVNYLRGDFELIKPLGDMVGDIEDLFIKFTEEQYKALDRMEYNKRVLFRGTAGTGKTLLAVEKAKRLAMTGKKVIFLCFNRILASKIRSSLKQHPNSELIIIESLHQYFLRIIESSVYYKEFQCTVQGKSKDELYKNIYPDYFIKALNYSLESYDYLIVDEGQDILCYEYFTALDYVLQGGLEHGNWSIFYDPNKQAEMYNNFDENLVNDLRGFGAAEYYLDFNCRNTKPIADAASIISGYNVETARVETGEPVMYMTYRTDQRQINHINNIINKLHSNGINYGQITILYPNPSYGDNIISKLQLNHIPVKITHSNAGELTLDKVSHCTAQSYKGMENNAIILTGIEELESDWISSVNYVGMTRAKQLLAVVYHENLNDSIKKKFIELIKGV